MNLFDTHDTNMQLVDILQVIPMSEKVRVRDIGYTEYPAVVTGTPKEIAFEKEEWLRCEVLTVTHKLSEVELMQIGIIGEWEEKNE